MRLAFCLFRYFPYGGVQRNFLRMAELCAQRGHDATLYTLNWQGPRPAFHLDVRIVEARGWRNHNRYEEFAAYVHREVETGEFDLVVGFNKMPGLDVYYAGDPCFIDAAHARRSALYRLSGRFRHFRDFERSVFDASAATRILLIAEQQKEHFQKWYGTPEERFHLLPPYVSRDRANGPPRGDARAAVAREIDMDEGDHLVLMIGSDYRRKGVARAVRAVAALPRDWRAKTRLVVLGNGRAWPCMALARGLGVRDRVHLLPGRSDVPVFLGAADLVLHPAIEENTGTAIVEAIAVGVPVLTTDNCGYAVHVERAGAGRVVPTPFDQKRLNEALHEMLSSPDRELWRQAAREYARRVDLFSRPERAVALLETFARGGAAHAAAPAAPIPAFAGVKP